MAEGKGHRDSDFTSAAWRATRRHPGQIQAAMSSGWSPASVTLEQGDRPDYVEDRSKTDNADWRAEDGAAGAVRHRHTAARLPDVEQGPLFEHVGSIMRCATRSDDPDSLSFRRLRGRCAGRAGLEEHYHELARRRRGGHEQPQIAEHASGLAHARHRRFGGPKQRNLSACRPIDPPRPLADIVKRPDFTPAELERLRTQTLTAIAQAQKDPNSMAARALPGLIYGANHPYATTGIGDAAAVTAITRDDLLGFQQSWLRPDNMEIYVVSSLPLAELMPKLEARFGTWAAPASPKGVKNFMAPPARPTSPRIVLIVARLAQSVILAAILPDRPASDIVRSGEAKTRRQLPFAYEMVRENRMVLWLAAMSLHPTPRPTSSAPRSRPTAPAISIVANQPIAVPNNKVVTAMSWSRGVSITSRRCPGGSKLGRGAVGDDEQRPLRPARQLF